MSQYLIERIRATSNIELQPNTELTQLHGDQALGLTAVSWRDARNGNEEERPIQHVFLFVGADPETQWLEGRGVGYDAQGFILTGQATEGNAAAYVAAPLESSIPGVFAVGDVRSGSVKRVGGAIGEGASAEAQIHQYLASADRTFEASGRKQHSMQGTT